MIDRIRLVALLARPSLVTIFGLFAAVGVAQGGWPRSIATLASVLVPVVGFVLFSVVINDLADRAIDEVNLPSDRGRPLVARTASDREFLKIGVACGLVSLVTGAMVGMAALTVLVAGMTLSAAYSMRPVRLADRGALASLLLPAGYVGVPYLVGILSVRNGLTAADLVLGVGLYVGFIGRILLKDFRDVRGDTLFGKRTFLVRHGRRTTCIASAVCWALGGLSLLALPQASVALVVAYGVQASGALVLLRKLAVSTCARRDERLIAAIAILGRGLVLTVLVHFSVMDAHWSGLAVSGLLLALATLTAGQAAVMAQSGPPRKVPRRMHEAPSGAEPLRQAASYSTRPLASITPPPHVVLRDERSSLVKARP